MIKGYGLDALAANKITWATSFSQADKTFVHRLINACLPVRAMQLNSMLVETF
jgi:hypothetical protein